MAINHHTPFVHKCIKCEAEVYWFVLCSAPPLLYTLVLCSSLAQQISAERTRACSTKALEKKEKVKIQGKKHHSFTFFTQNL
jgi:hypothetical protein